MIWPMRKYYIVVICYILRDILFKPLPWISYDDEQPSSMIAPNVFLVEITKHKWKKNHIFAHIYMHFD